MNKPDPRPDVSKTVEPVISDLPTVHLRVAMATFPLSEGDVLGVATTHDGEIIDQHISSSVDYLRADLRRSYHLAIYAARFPDGYRIVDEL